jgi:ribonuclease HII
MIDEKKLETLKEWKVKDSKLLTPRRRSFLYQKLKKLADDMVILKISAMEIDKNKTISNLNKLWFHRVQGIINALGPQKIYVDALEANEKKCHDKIHKGLKEELKNAEIVCENAADRKYLVVGAASIVAKVVRDAEIRKLHREYGDFGSGYTSDERTIKFLKDWIKKNKHFPHFVRHSWITAVQLRKDRIQSKLGDFANEK